jgi:hypothetical protein
MFIRIFLTFMKILSYFWYATFGKDVNYPLWERQSGDRLICIFNNKKAALSEIEKINSLGVKAILGTPGQVFPRLNKVIILK